VDRDDGAAGVPQRDRVARAEEDVEPARVARQHEVLPELPGQLGPDLPDLERVGEPQVGGAERLAHEQRHPVGRLEHRVPVPQEVLDVASDPEALPREPLRVHAQPHALDSLRSWIGP
jgi:hypothetical protein